MAAGIRARRDNWNGPELAALKAANPSTTIWRPSCKCKRTAAFVGNDGGPDFQFIPEATVPCTVLDPFAGSGTTGAVALELGRHAILIELNPEYCELIEERCNTTLGLALA
jgi:16S rRNA G966 N2-methylase RsmD